jgi:hypothetical protein
MVYAHAGWCELKHVGEVGVGEINNQNNARYSTTGYARSCADQEQEVHDETADGTATHGNCSTRMFDL